MKSGKYIFSPFVILGALSLSACAMFGDGNSQSSNNSQSSGSGHADMQANQQAADKATVTVEAPKSSSDESSKSEQAQPQADSGVQPSSTIDLESKDNRVYAHVVTNWGDAKEGSLSIKWIPPQGSNCQESSFVITKYSDTNDDTWAYRTYNSSVHQCTGIWQAQVISDNGNVLSSSEVDAK